MIEPEKFELARGSEQRAIFRTSSGVTYFDTVKVVSVIRSDQDTEEDVVVGPKIEPRNIGIYGTVLKYTPTSGTPGILYGTPTGFPADLKLLEIGDAVITFLAFDSLAPGGNATVIGPVSPAISYPYENNICTVSASAILTGRNWTALGGMCRLPHKILLCAEVMHGTEVRNVVAITNGEYVLLVDSGALGRTVDDDVLIYDAKLPSLEEFAALTTKGVSAGHRAPTPIASTSAAAAKSSEVKKKPVAISGDPIIGSSVTIGSKKKRDAVPAKSTSVKANLVPAETSTRR